MKIKLDNKITLTTDQNNFMLNKSSIATSQSKTPGKERLTSFAYYSTLGAALKGYLKHAIRNEHDDIFDVTALMYKLEEINQTIKSLNKG